MIKQLLFDSILNSESCGLAAAINIPNASWVTRQLLTQIQHRGPAGAGIASYNDSNLYIHTDFGLVESIFHDNFNYDKRLPGNYSFGFNRYPTRGSVDEHCNIQPTIFQETKFGRVGFAHNGQLADINNVKDDLKEKGAIFQTTSDSETLAQLVLKSNEPTLEKAIESEINKIPSSYSVIFATESKLIALRDQYGVKPLSIGKLNDGYLVASESYAFKEFKDAEFVRDVQPGEMVIFDTKTNNSKKGFRSIQFADAKEFFCVMELKYFSHPRSRYNNIVIEDIREQLGIQLYIENKEYFDSLKQKHGDNVCIVPILDSGKHAAIGLEETSGIKRREYFMRKRHGRSYTAPDTAAREYIAYNKLDLREDKIKGKVIITVDDTEVRGHTSRINNDRLWVAGALEVHNAIASRPITLECYLGMDHQIRNELVAYRNITWEDIAKETHSTNTIFLTSSGEKKVLDMFNITNLCDGCFGGKYPVYLNNHD